MRNQKNMMFPVGPHSYADFRMCDECLIYREQQKAKEGDVGEPLCGSSVLG